MQTNRTPSQCQFEDGCSTTYMHERRTTFCNSFFDEYMKREITCSVNVSICTLHKIGIVAYLLKPRTVEAEKQPLLGNGPYTRSKEMRHVRYDVTQQ
jgi:hypothetical protein